MALRLSTAFLALIIIAVQPAYADQPGDSGVEKALRFKPGDEAGNELKALKTELLVIRSEKRALAQLLKLHKKYKGTRMEPEVLFRLAEIYMRRARSERFFEIHRNSQQVLMFAPQHVKNASEAAEIRKAIEYYGRIQEKFPRYHAMDIVIFNNAYAHQQLNEDRQAEALFSKLIQKYPYSPLIPDAYLAIGEINFAARNFKVALENFKAIRKYPKARVYPYGLYKAAWSYYNLHDTEAGIRELEDVVQFGRQVAANGWDSKLDLRKEALGDLALFFSDVRKSKDAVDYFVGQAQDLDPVPYIMRLVEIYKRHSRYNDIETVLKDALAKLPESDAIAVAHEELIWNFERTKRQSESVAQLEAFDAFCERGEAKLEGGKRKKNVIVEPTQCRMKVAETSKKLATKWHAVWKKFGESKKGSNELATSSEKAYRLYLKNPAGDKDVALVRYAFAELQFARKQYREASELYAAIEQDRKLGAAIDPKVAHDAAYAAVVSLERAVGDKWNDDDEKRFIELSESYIRNNPKGQYVTDLRFKRAFIAYEKERYDEAAPQFKRIGWAPYPKDAKLNEKVVRAQDLYLDILNIKKDYKGIKEASQELLRRGGEPARVAHIEKIYREAYFAEIQVQEEKGDLPGAIEAYKKFALENKNSPLAPKAWWNASQLQFRLGDATGGASTCYEMHKLFPNSTNGKDCLTQAAATFESMARLDLAARVLLNLAEVDVEQQLKWRELAADFFALSGSKERAIIMYTKLAEGLKGNQSAHMTTLLEKAAQLARDTNDTASLRKIESMFTAKGIEPQSSRMIVEEAERAFESGDHTKAFNLSKKIIANSSLPKDLLARARFVQARVLEDEYRRQSVKARVERIGLVLAIKTEKLEKAQKAYQSTIRYGDPQISVQALQRLANCYLDYAKTVRGMTLPDTVSAADKEAFRKEIEQITIPMEEKGIETMHQALEMAKKAQLRGGEIAELQKEVDRLNMKSVETPVLTVAVPKVYLPYFRAPASKEMMQ